RLVTPKHRKPSRRLRGRARGRCQTSPCIDGPPRPAAAAVGQVGRMQGRKKARDEGPSCGPVAPPAPWADQSGAVPGGHFFPGPISPGRRPAAASALGRAASAAATATTGTAATAAAAGTASWPASRGFLLFLFQGRHLGVQPPLVGEAAE